MIPFLVDCGHFCGDVQSLQTHDITVVAKKDLTVSIYLFIESGTQSAGGALFALYLPTCPLFIFCYLSE